MSIPLLFVIAITAVTLLIGLWASRGAKTAADMMVAGRSVGVGLNAAAISGEYLSAASFMGIAALVMKNGFDALWYPVGYAAGYLFLLLFIAGPLRRFGAYTIPDFAEGRFASPHFRRIAVLFVLSIGFFYTMPQMKGAGVTMQTILGWPYWVGLVVVGSVITLNVAIGGMKGITLVQAFQYWAKLFAISVPLFVILAVVGPNRLMPWTTQVFGFGGGFVGLHTIRDDVPGRKAMGTLSLERVLWPDTVPRSDRRGFESRVIRSYQSGEALPSPLVDLPEGAVARVGFVVNGQTTFSSVSGDSERTKASAKEMKLKGVQGAPANALTTPKGGTLMVRPATPTRIRLKEGRAYLLPTSRHLNEIRSLPLGRIVAAGELVPVARGEDLVGIDGAKLEVLTPTTAEVSSTGGVANRPERESWLQPFGPLTQKHGYPLLYTFSLIVALVCGTAGLPHILVRFYTNPDGRSARRTAFWTMVLLGAFYVFTPAWGILGRSLVPELYLNNSTDAVVIRLPQVVLPGFWGEVLTGVTAAGAFAAFMSTFSGLLVSMSGAFAHDVYGTMIHPGASDAQRRRAFGMAAVLIGAVAMGLGLLVESFDIAMMVGWAFAIGAASYFPLLLLGCWWRGLTAKGAATGMLTGGLMSLAAIVFSMLLDKKVVDVSVPPLLRSLMEQPAIWGVPLSLIIMVMVSRASRPPANATDLMLRLHDPRRESHPATDH